MAASKSYFAGANYRFLPTDPPIAHHHDPIIFELDESDIWNSPPPPASFRSESPEFLRKSTAARISRKQPAPAATGSNRRPGDPSSLPVNVPDWSKILKDEYRETRRSTGDDDDYDEDAAEYGDRIPPHEFLARQLARTRIASFSVHEGIGRTLKGRDLSRVRNAIWQKTGFED